MKVTKRIRCGWARTPLSIAYHDAEWGVPVHDDRILFEFLTLEGAQAGLSWETILKKRAGYRTAFADFDPARVARFTPARIERLLENPDIVRNRLKISSTVSNARAFLAVQREFGTFDAYLWELVGGSPRVNRWRSLDQLPSRTAESDTLSRDLLAETSDSSVRRSVMPSCKRSGSSTITRSIASDTDVSGRQSDRKAGT